MSAYLTEVSVNSNRGSSSDDPSVLLLLEVRPGGVADGESSLEMGRVDGVPFLLGHGGERLVSENTGIADNDWMRDESERPFSSGTDERSENALWMAPKASMAVLTSC